MKELDYIIVQAGGKGSRMEHLTTNKPKSLVPVNNLPMLFHLFRKYPDKHFIIIGDYKYEVMRKYLEAFADVKYLLADARGKSGTCAGISTAVRMIPAGEPFMLIWSDLILPEEFTLPEVEESYVGLSGDFRCRWKYENGVFEEEPSVERGVAGFFLFKDKSELEKVPEEGEFVRWLQSEGRTMKELVLSRTKEYGLISEYNKLEQKRCRPFNRMTEENGKIIKEGIDEQGRALAVREKNWYQFLDGILKKTGMSDGIKEFPQVPQIDSFTPFVMEKIDGKNIYEYDNLGKEEKKAILTKLVDMLKQLHSLGSADVDYYSMKDAYYTKTVGRLSKIRELVPFADQRTIRVNGRECRNVFFCFEELEQRLNELSCERFSFLHGDCTFSNLMLRHDTEPVMIDPRGYFGYTENYGDAAYDWAKLYYSIVGNYDRFNRKEFRLTIDETGVSLEIESNHWEDMEEEFFGLLENEVTREQIKLIHAVIWLSLTTYAWDDYDSICGAFYNGIYYLEEVL